MVSEDSFILFLACDFIATVHILPVIELIYHQQHACCDRFLHLQAWVITCVPAAHLSHWRQSNSCMLNLILTERNTGFFRAHTSWEEFYTQYLYCNFIEKHEDVSQRWLRYRCHIFDSAYCYKTASFPYYFWNTFRWWWWWRGHRIK